MDVRFRDPCAPGDLADRIAALAQLADFVNERPAFGRGRGFGAGHRSRPQRPGERGVNDRTQRFRVACSQNACIACPADTIE
jgi:hypothetical protein